MKTIIWLTRHGETRYIDDRRFNGRRDIHLTNAGREHCQKLADKLAVEPIDVIISSPLARCRETAEILARPHNLPVKFDERLREMDYGQWEGLTYQEACARDIELFTQWENDPAAVAPPGGESGEQVAARVIPAFDDIRTRYRGNQVLIVAHKTVNRILLCYVRNRPISDHRRNISQEPCALNRIEVGADRQSEHT